MPATAARTTPLAAFFSSYAVPVVSGSQEALRLAFGDKIGSQSFGFSARMLSAAFLSLAKGSWDNKSGYLGFEYFDNAGLAHFGWAKMSVSVTSSRITGNLRGYAYDTVAGETIFAGQTTTPEPGTLGLLALGAAGLALWRKRKQGVGVGD